MNWLTTQQAKKLTGYSRTTLYRLRLDNKVKFKTAKKGRRTLYEETSLENLFNQNEL